MIDNIPHTPPSKLIPVLIGGVSMALVSSIPVLNLVNCACCAGIMGTAILGVWFYKKNFAENDPFTVGDGAVIGTLSGLVGGLLSAVVQMIQLGVFTGNFSQKLAEQMDVVYQEMNNAPSSDPQAMEQVRQLVDSLATNPGLLIIILLAITLIVFVGFGALGGVIGGAIMKRRPPVYNFPVQ